MKKKILLTGPFLSQSGYGYQARFALEALMTAQDEFDIYINNTGWGMTGVVTERNEVTDFIRNSMRRSSEYYNSGGTFDAHLQVSIPNEIKRAAPINILYTAGIETTEVAPEWLDKIRQVNSLIVVSNHAKEVFKNTSYDVQDQNGNKFKLACEVPIDVVNYCYKKGTKVPKIDLDYDFNFLAVAQISPRKNLENLVRWFYDEFHDDHVGLVLKCSLMSQSTTDRMHTENKLNQLLDMIKEEYKDPKCKMYLLHGDLNDEEMRGLYKHPKIKAMVSTTHGEGYGLPLFEAAYMGLPVVTHGWSGQSDFLYIKGKPMFADCEFAIGPVQPEARWKGVITNTSQWAYIDGNSFRKKIRDVYSNLDQHEEVASKLKKHITKEFSPEKKYKEFVDAIMSHFVLGEDEIEGWLDDMVFYGDEEE